MFKKISVTVVFLIGTFCHAQTIAPIHNEYKTKVGKFIRGSFQVQNNNLTPEALVLQPMGLTFNERGPQHVVLPATVHVTLNRTSMRLGPKEIAEIDYKVSCDALPCAVAVANIFTVGHTTDGVEVRLILPFSIYLGTSKHPRADMIATGKNQSVTAGK